MKHDAAPWTDKQDGHTYLDRNKIDQLYEKFRKLAREKFGIDSDGDIPLDIKIIDRTRYERMHFFAVPYDFKVVTDTEHDGVLNALISNLSIAAEALNRWHRCLDHNPRPLTATDENLASENRQLVERNKTVEMELMTMRREHAVQIRKDEAVKSARTKRDAMAEALHHLWDCDIDNCKECEIHKQNQRLEGKRPPRKSERKPSP